MGITGINAKDYAIGCLGMLPGTVVYVFIGTTISDIADAASGNNDQKTLVLVLFIVGSILACAGIMWVSFVAKRYLHEALAEKENELKE